MNRWIKGMAIALLLCLLASCACAQEAVLSVRRADGVGDAVASWDKGYGKHILGLPAYMQGQALEVTLSGARSVKLGETALESGMVTDGIADGVSLALSRGETLSVMASRNLPAVHITTESGTLDHIHKKKGNKEAGQVKIVTADGETVLDAPLDSVKGHGNATFVYEKKSYQFKLEKKQEFLGMDKGKSFVLLANQHENSFLRNRMTFDLARALEIPFAPLCQNVDLYMNGEYRGSYLLCEKVSIGSAGVDITQSEDLIEFANEAFIEHGGEAERYGRNKYEKGTYKGFSWPREPEDITGGYLLELEYQDRYADEVSGVVTPKGQPVVVKEPEKMTAAQGEYIYALLAGFERAIFGEGGVDPETGRHYTEIADMNSLVRKYMIEEISRNYDGNKSSQYFFKDSDEIDPLLYAGPVWDYDSAWGNFAKEGRLDLAEPKGLSVAEHGYEYSWWPALCKQADFAAAVSSTYDEQMRGLLQVLTGEKAAEEGMALRALDDYASEVSASAKMNFERWRVLNHNTRAVKTGATYEENIEYLRTWIQERIAYLDQVW